MEKSTACCSYSVCLASIISIWGEIRKSIVDTLFIENEENLEHSGKIIEQSNEHQNVKVTIKGIVGYDKVLSIIYDVEKTDGIAFKGNYLSFYSYMEIKDGKQTAKYIIKDNREIYSEHTELKREYVATIDNYFENVDFVEDEQGRRLNLKGVDVNNFKGKKMNLVIEEIDEQYYGKKISDFDLAQYVTKYGKANALVSQESQFKLYKFGDSEPQNINMIENEHLGIVPYSEYPTVTIESIGFVDQKLHLITSHTTNPFEENALPYVDSSNVRWKEGRLMLDNNICIDPYRKKGENGHKCYTPETYCLRVVDTTGKKINCPILSSYGKELASNSKIEKYEVYDIKNVEELRKYKLMAILRYNEAVVQDKWKIPFETDMQEDRIDIPCNEKIKDDVGKKWRVDKLRLSNVYLHIQLTCLNQVVDNQEISMSIKIIMKDGKEYRLLESSRTSCEILNPYEGIDKGQFKEELKAFYVYESLEGSTVNIDGVFLKAKNIDQIESIQIGEKRIPIKR